MIQGAAHHLTHSCVPENVPVLQEDILESPPGESWEVVDELVGCLVLVTKKVEKRWEYNLATPGIGHW